MKHLKRALLLLFIFSATSSFGQSFKFGYVNSQELIDLMPERDSAMLKLDSYSKDIQSTLQEIQNEYETKVTQYQQKQATWTAATLEIRQKEISDIQSRYQQFTEKSNYEFQQMRQILFAPVYQKANDTITAIGKEYGFTFIFDIATGAVPYFDKDQSTDVTAIAKSKLKIPADKKPMVIPQQEDAPPVQ